MRKNKTESCLAFPVRNKVGRAGKIVSDQEGQGEGLYV